MTGTIEKITLPEHEQAAAGGVVAAPQVEQGASLRTPSGSDLPIPPELAHLFEVLAGAAASGHEITVTVGDPRLRPRDAAAELCMSRTHLCKLMDDGRLAFERVGTHRRIARSEVERFRHERANRIAEIFRTLPMSRWRRSRGRRRVAWGARAATRDVPEPAELAGTADAGICSSEPPALN